VCICIEGVHLYRMVVPQGWAQHRQVCIYIEAVHLYRRCALYSGGASGDASARQVCICRSLAAARSYREECIESLD